MSNIMIDIKKTIGVDVDCTITDICHKWVDFCCASPNYSNFEEDRYYRDVENENVDYNITNYFEIADGVDFLEFWKDPNLYNDVECYQEAVDTIKALYYTGWKVIFISYCNECGSHAQSKADMLRSCFSFIHPDHFHFVQTKSKGVLREALGAFADDRCSFINQMKGDVLCFKVKTPYTQDAEILYDNVIEVDGWKDIGKVLI
ncbi:hypothetical protein MYOV057v1_p0181 [Vibrio phage 184E37.1]|nr:hypothetical protein MYOV057v1_p0181 [Vibrio phage 184E37.1]